MMINDWQTTINAIRNLTKGGNPKTRENNYNRLIQFLKEKGIRIDELNTQYNQKVKE